MTLSSRRVRISPVLGVVNEGVGRTIGRGVITGPEKIEECGVPGVAGVRNGREGVQGGAADLEASELRIAERGITPRGLAKTPSLEEQPGV